MWSEILSFMLLMIVCAGFSALIAWFIWFMETLDECRLILDRHERTLEAQAQTNTELEESIKRVRCEAMSGVSCLEHWVRCSPDDK